jgi:hypothetical protein
MRPKTTDTPTRWRAKPRHADKIESIPTIKGGIVRTITFGTADQRTNFLRTFQRQLKEESMKKPAIALALLMLILPFAGRADDLPSIVLPSAPTPKLGSMPTPARVQMVAPVKENSTGSYLFFYASAACGSGLAASGDRAKSAEIGVPIYLGLNFLAHKIHSNHPKISYLLQGVSPIGCFSGLNKNAKKSLVTSNSTGGNEGGTPIVTPPVSGSGGSNSGSGSSTGSNPGVNPPGSGNGSDPGSSGGGTGGSGSGSGGSTGGTGSGGGNPPPTGICIQDCGLGGANGGGNGGFNSGNDGKKPPFKGIGRH